MIFGLLVWALGPSPCAVIVLILKPGTPGIEWALNSPQKNLAFLEPH